MASKIIEHQTERPKAVVHIHDEEGNLVLARPTERDRASVHGLNLLGVRASAKLKLRII